MRARSAILAFAPTVFAGLAGLRPGSGPQRTRGAILALALAVLPGLVSVPGRAEAAPPAELPATLALEEDRVVADFSVASAFTEAFRRRVSGGLESRVEIETQLLDREGTVVGRGRRSCKLLYSLWDEQVYVSVEDEGRAAPAVSTFVDVEPALAACAVTRALPVALAGALVLQDGYRLEVRVALNPVSEELVERSRQFISNPRGGARGRPNAVLGAVAGLFSGRGGALGETSDYRSPALARPSRSDAMAGRAVTATSGRASSDREVEP